MWLWLLGICCPYRYFKEGGKNEKYLPALHAILPWPMRCDASSFIPASSILTPRCLRLSPNTNSASFKSLWSLDNFFFHRLSFLSRPCVLQLYNMEGLHPSVYNVTVVAFGDALKETFCILSDIAWNILRTSVNFWIRISCSFTRNFVWLFHSTLQRYLG